MPAERLIRKAPHLRLVIFITAALTVLVTGHSPQAADQDNEAMKENNPADIALRNKAALNNLTLWLFTGTRDVAQEDSQWAHQFLEANGIAHRFEITPDTGHALKRHFEFFGDDIFQMLGKHFATSKTFAEQSKIK